MTLNTEQKKVLNEFLKPDEKNILILAPAGTGKTYCSIQFAQKYVVGNCIKEYEKILILTFSRNARAQIIKELHKVPRISKIYNHIEITNYHSFMKNYIDKYRDIIGINKPIDVLDDEEFKIEINTFYKRSNDYKIDLEYLSDFNMEDNKLVKVNPQTKIKNMIDSEKKYLELRNFINITGKIYFSAFGKVFCNILEKSKDLARYIAHDYPIIILDEYQDTDYFQSKFLTYITTYTKNLYFADECQMIYEFRGASKLRLDDLIIRCPDIKKYEFNEIFRYKNKPDILQILNNIRQGTNIDYNSLKNGKIIECNIKANNEWQMNNNQSLLSSACTMTFYALIRIVKEALHNQKSICLLTRKITFADKLTKTFVKNNFLPRVIADTKEMMFINRQLKKIFDSNQNIIENIPNILSVIASCKNFIKIDDEEISEIMSMSFEKLRKKRKPEYKEYYNIINSCIRINDHNSKSSLLYNLLNCLYIQPFINYVRANYVLECIKVSNPTPQIFDNLLLQKQYVNSFSDIISGLYITTIHQSKGREFDYVCVIDIDNIQNEKNLLYVSHSRMKEKLFPVKFNFVGVQWG